MTIPDASTPIVGTWEAATADLHNFGATLDFAPGGRFTMTVGVMSKFHYTNANGKLTTAARNPETGDTNDFTTIVSIEHDILVQKPVGDAGFTTRMQRVGRAKPGDYPILGTWTRSDDTEGISFVAFRKNGQGSFRLPMNSCSGTWKDAGSGHLTATMNRDFLEWNYSIESGVLVLRDLEGHEQKYNRVLSPAR